MYIYAQYLNQIPYVGYFLYGPNLMGLYFYKSIIEMNKKVDMTIHKHDFCKTTSRWLLISIGKQGTNHSTANLETSQAATLSWGSRNEVGFHN